MKLARAPRASAPLSVTMLLMAAMAGPSFAKEADANQWLAPPGMKVSITDLDDYKLDASPSDGAARDNWKLTFRPSAGATLATDSVKGKFRVVPTTEPLVALKGGRGGVFHCTLTEAAGTSRACFADKDSDGAVDHQCLGKAQVMSFAAMAAAATGGPAAYQKPPGNARFDIAIEFVTGCKPIAPIALTPLPLDKLPRQLLDVTFSAEPSGAVTARATTKYSMPGSFLVAEATTAAAGTLAQPQRLALLGASFDVWTEAGAARAKLVSIDPESSFSDRQE